MALGLDYDRSWMKPLTSEGNVVSDQPGLENMIGCYEGDYLGYNVVNPLPNYEYRWRLMTPASRIQIQQSGGTIVHHGDPDGAAYSVLMENGAGGFAPSASDSVVSNGEVMLVRWPLERVREEHEREEQKALSYARGGAEEYVGGQTPAERHFSGGRATRFRAPDHMIQYQDAEGRPVEVWTPDRGVIDEA